MHINELMKKIKPIHVLMAIFFVLVFYVSFVLNPNRGDDLVILERTKDLSLIDLLYFVEDLYMTASSRFIINTVWFIYLRVPQIVFNATTLFMFILLAYSLWKLTAEKMNGEHGEEHMLIAIMSFVLIYPFVHMETAGWYATVISYFWPATLAVYALVYIKKAAESKNIKIYEYVTFSLAVIFSSNCEQICVGLTVAFALHIVYSLMTKRFRAFSVVLLFFCIANLVLSLACPGNTNRVYTDTVYYMPDFTMLSVVNKIVIGFYTTMYYLVVDESMIFAIFSFLLCYAIFTKYSHLLFRFISVIPISFILLFSIFKDISKHMFPFLSDLFSRELSKDLLTTDMNDISRSIVLLTYLIMFFIIFISIYLIFENTIETIIGCLFFGSSIVLRVILGFAPSVYVSGLRSFIVTYFAIIICSLYIYRKIIETDHRKNYRTITISLCGMAFLTFLNLIPSFYR